MLERIHVGHNGVNGCIRRAQETVFYPGITADIKKLVATCDVCQRHLIESAKEPLMPHQTPSRPWERVGVDIFTHLTQDYLVTVDYLSGYFEIDRLSSKKATDVIYVLRQQFARHGIPSQVVSDNSPFGSAEFRAFAANWEFEHITSSPNYPQSNGRAEAAVKQAKRLMQKASEAGTDPLIALLEWRNTPTETSGLSPCQLMYGRHTRTRVPTASALLNNAFAPTARRALDKSKEKQAAYYNKSARERPTLKVGQTVRARFNDNTWRKAEVAKRLPYRAYEVRMEDGTTRRRTSRHVRFSSEPPVVIKDEQPEEDERPSGERTTQPAAAVAVSARPAETGSDGHRLQNSQTRSGRIVRRPARFCE